MDFAEVGKQNAWRVPATKISSVISYLKSTPRGAFCVAKSPGSTAEARGCESLREEAKIARSSVGPPALVRRLRSALGRDRPKAAVQSTNDQALPRQRRRRWLKFLGRLPISLATVSTKASTINRYQSLVETACNRRHSQNNAALPGPRLRGCATAPSPQTPKPPTADHSANCPPSPAGPIPPPAG